MGYALIFDGKVVEVSSEAFDVAEGMSWRDVSDVMPPPEVGWLDVDGTLTPPPVGFIAPTIADMQRGIEEKRDSALVSGFDFNGVVYPSDNVFQSQLGHYLLAWQVGLLDAGATVPVRRMDNVTVQLDKSDVTALAGALMVYVQTVWQTSWAEKDALRGA